MQKYSIEAEYPLIFRKKEAEQLGKFLKHRETVDLIGMKRVGISNFLRFFLYHNDIASIYIKDNQQHVFIPIDLNDLVERELFPFWTLTLKRIVDIADDMPIPEQDKKSIESLFLKAIQSQELFLAIDSVRQALVTILSHNYLPTLFFIRFDRLKDAVTPEFFDNLKGLQEATNQQLSYVFTSDRSLDQLSPLVFAKSSLLVFSQNMYMSLAHREDMKSVYDSYNNRYQLDLSQSVENELLTLVGGHIQYLQVSLILLREKTQALQEKELFDVLMQDERIHLQSEELWESLTEDEKTVLMKIVKQEIVTDDEREKAAYLWDTGFVIKSEGKEHVFSPLFAQYLSQLVQKNHSNSVHFSKKEHLLFQLLEQNLNQICEREAIIETVWAEYTELGVSDWAIDRLVARVRTKLREQQSQYEIKTIRTRGYQLVLRST